MPFCPQCGEESPSTARFCASCGSPLGRDGAAAAATPAAPPARESRRTVTILFCDLTGSTSLGEQLDPESLRRVMAAYFEHASGVIERHGGTVEKFIGDAIMAVFGIPVLHEDDALRAVRAASELRDGLAALNEELRRDWGVTIQTRTGVNTGEVVAGSGASGHTFATGDTVNVAARLEQAAAPGEILIGASTYRLVRDAVEAEPVDPLSLKGKAAPVAAWRLRGASTELPGLLRRLDSPLVGRDDELAVLEQAFADVTADRSCRLLTIFGPAGAGKSRLAQELVASVRDRATVLEGRCIPYGEGITYFPVALIVKQLAAIEDGDSAAEARAKVGSLLTDVDDSTVVADRLATAIGLADVVARPEEISWAVRRLFESLAAERPLVVVFDDIHWAELTFLDLIEYLAGFSRDASILVVCTARPELMEARPAWGNGHPHTSSIALDPLGEAQSELLVANLLGGAELAAEARARIARVAEGNPLFVEEVLRMLIDEGLLERRNGRWTSARDLSELALPPSIEALLAARIDRLEPEERGVLERASVVGRVFGWSAVVSLSPEAAAPHVGTYLRRLVRKELVRVDPGDLSEDAFRFSHILIRDVAYRGLPKDSRADLHERFAAWLEERTGERATEYEEILGYHLEQAFRYRTELRPLDERGEELRARAAERLGAAGRRAFARGDVTAAANLLERSASLLPTRDPGRLDLLPLLGRVLLQLGRLDAADAALTDAAEEATAIGDRRRLARALVGREFVRLQTDPAGRTDELLRVTDEAIPVFEESGDELGLARAWRLRSEVDRLKCRWGAEAAALERALVHARRAGDEREEVEISAWLGTSLCYGPTPVREAIPRCHEMLERGRGVRSIQTATLAMLAYLQAMHGRFDEARELYGRSKALLEELGMTFAVAGRVIIPAAIERLAGDPEATERELRWGYELLEQAGENELRSTVAAHLGHSLYAQARYDEAERFAEISEQTAAADDVFSQVAWRSARAKVRARRDGDGEAEGLAREAVRLAATTDFLSMHGAALLDLAEVLRLLGRPSEAGPLIEDAIWLFERKDDTVSAGRAHAALLELTAMR